MEMATEQDWELIWEHCQYDTDAVHTLIEQVRAHRNDQLPTHIHASVLRIIEAQLMNEVSVAG